MATQAKPSSVIADDLLHDISACSRPPHVVVVPFPADGHLNPCLSLAHFLASSAIAVTLVQPAHSLTAHSQHSNIPPTSLVRPSSPVTQPLSGPYTQGSHGNIDLPPFRIEVIPGGFDRSTPFTIPIFKSALDLMHKHVSDLLHRLMLEENAPVCLLIDSFFFWGSACAREFGLPLVLLYTSSASSFCLGLHLPDLAARNLIPATEEGAKDKVVDFVPGLSPFRVADMPRGLMAEEGLQSDKFLLFSSIFQHAKSADRILVNTFYELEGSPLDALRKEDHVAIDPVGPLFMMSTAAPARQLPDQEGDSQLMTWLDQQQEASVLYIAFGSIATLQEEVFAELAHGLEASGQSFVWVIRPDAYEGKASVEEIVPEGLADRTRGGGGRIVEWAPQLAVLGHSAVGAFLTHCGWNSVMESLSNGVPMLGFPQIAEQKSNLKLMVHDWKVALPLVGHCSTIASANELQPHGGGGGKVEAECVRSAIMAIMSGEEGTQVRRCAHEWKQVARKATQEGAGSSKDNLQKIVHDLKHGLFKS